jgi:hypothetical protein
METERRSRLRAKMSSVYGAVKVRKMADAAKAMPASSGGLLPDLPSAPHPLATGQYGGGAASPAAPATAAGRRDNRPAWMVEGDSAKRTKYETAGGASVVSSGPVLNTAALAASALASASLAGSQAAAHSTPDAPVSAVASGFGLASGGGGVGGGVGGLSMAKKSAAAKPRPGLKQPTGAFAEEVESRRALVKLDEDDGPGSGSAASGAATAESEALRDQRIAESLPRDKEGLFRYPIAWAAVDAHDVVELKLRKWISGKIAEYLGAEEATLIDFVVAKLKAHAAPQAILDELKLVLEDDAEGFVTKLWKVLAFHATKLAAT